MYVVVIITDTHLYRMQAENDKKYTIGTGKKDVMEIPELGESSLSLIFHANPQRLEVKGKKIRLTAMTLSEPSNLQQICDSPKISIRWSEDGGEYKESCPIPYDCQIHIGRGLSNDIVLRENYISRKHLVVTSDKGQIRIEDLGSTNGIYLNGSPVTKAMLKSGDVIDILELRIRCENSRLFFENLHSVPEIKDHAEGAGTGVVFTPEGTGYLSYHRSPRIRESLPDRPVTLSHVPNKPRIFGKKRRADPGHQQWRNRRCFHCDGSLFPRYVGNAGCHDGISGCRHDSRKREKSAENASRGGRGTVPQVF